MATDLSHLHALSLRLSNERARFASARSAQERELRAVWMAGIEKEIAQERAYLGLPDSAEIEGINDDDLLAELSQA